MYTLSYCRIISMRFATQEFRTSKVCNICEDELARYRTRRGKLSHSRLKCTNYNPTWKPRFLGRDRRQLRIFYWLESHTRGHSLCIGEKSVFSRAPEIFGQKSYTGEETVLPNKPPEGAGGAPVSEMFRVSTSSS